MKVQGQAQGLEAFQADRLARRDATDDPALRAHFEQELNLVKLMMEPQGHAVPSPGSASEPGAAHDAASTAAPAAPPREATDPYAPAPSGAPATNTPSHADDPQRKPFDENLARQAASNPSASVSAGAGPNVIYITNDQHHEITVGKFRNLESTTEPSAQITLKPGETGALFYENGEAGIMTQADADGNFRPDASRLEYQSEADGSKRFPDISYIDGRNASILLTDGKDFNKGDSISIAEDAPDHIISTDSAGNKTITGWYDGSTEKMQAGGQYMEDILGTNGAYLHPDDDRRPPGSNPMTATDSSVLFARFGAP